MFRKYRCYHDIIYDILKVLATEGPQNITKLCMYTRIPVDRGSKILSLLERSGLVVSYTRVDGVRVYEITSRGYEYIAIYEELLKLIQLFIDTHKL